MKILEVLTYHRPHISGLTIYVERLCQALADRGHRVSVLTSHYAGQLPYKEKSDGVYVRRIPVAFRISKGVIMPTFGLHAWPMVLDADIVHLHLPQFDAPGVALRGRLLGKPVVLTYHSDLRLPSGLFNRAVNEVVNQMNRAAGFLADAVVTYTRDFAINSPYLSRYVGRKLHVIPPPVDLPLASGEQVSDFRRRHNLNGKRIIGISARLAAEKGIEVLFAALPRILGRFPEAHVLHACPEAIGEKEYAERLAPLFKKYRESYQVLDPLEGTELSAFYQSLDCLVLCSLNSTETFGLVQIEAMMHNVPVVASDLPGVRQPVNMTGMGEVVPVGDPTALADAVVRILANRGNYLGLQDQVAQSFDPGTTAQEYERLFISLLQGNDWPLREEPTAYDRLRRMRDSIRQ